MQEFTALRIKAREKRDKAVKAAQDEYALTLVKIASLEQDLNGHRPSNHKSIASCIESVIPERPFTTVDVMTALEALDPSRTWRKRAIDSHIYRLREKGLVRRLKKARNKQPALYVRKGVEVEPIPFEGMTLAEVVKAVLGDNEGMNQTELTMAILEQGYETSMKPKALRDAVGVILRGSANI